MSTSRHPIALSLERLVGGRAKLLATVMGLPLVDGIFPAMVLAGAMDSPIGILEVGLLVFGGSATVAVILAEMGGTRKEQVSAVLVVGVGIVLVAAVEAALAPTIESLIVVERFERFAALVIIAVAAKTASARVGEYLPRPAVIIGLGLLGSLNLAGAQFDTASQSQVINAVAAAGVGAGFALTVAVFAPHLRERVNIDRFRFGSAVALGLLGLSVLNVGNLSGAPLAVIAVTAVFALDPNGLTTEDGDTADPSGAVADGGMADGDDDVDMAAERTAADDPVMAPTSDAAPRESIDDLTTRADRDVDGPAADGTEAAADGVEPDHDADHDEAGDASDESVPNDDGSGDVSTDTSGRAPWL